MPHSSIEAILTPSTPGPTRVGGDVNLCSPNHATQGVLIVKSMEATFRVLLRRGTVRAEALGAHTFVPSYGASLEARLCRAGCRAR